MPIDNDFTPALAEAAAYRARIATNENENKYLKTENARLRTALQNCRMFFDANNRPNHVAMIDEAMGNEQKVGDIK